MHQDANQRLNDVEKAQIVETKPITKPAESKDTANPTETSPNPIQQGNPNTPSNPQPVATSPPATIGSAYVMYRVASDGASAQVTPVKTTLSGFTGIELTVDLQCLGGCNFRLVSDTYTISDATTYASSQKIKYIISTPGDYIFYNQFTPGTKFGIKF